MGTIWCPNINNTKKLVLKTKSTLTNKRKNKMLPNFFVKATSVFMLRSSPIIKEICTCSLHALSSFLKKCSNLQKNKPTHPSIPYIIQNFNATTNFSILPKSQHLFVVFLITYNEIKFGKYINIK